MLHCYIRIILAIYLEIICSFIVPNRLKMRSVDPPFQPIGSDWILHQTQEYFSLADHFQVKKYRMSSTKNLKFEISATQILKDTSIQLHNLKNSKNYLKCNSPSSGKKSVFCRSDVEFHIVQ